MVRSQRERVSENLNRALHAMLEKDPRVWMIGEDVSDPYGGAFKITKGLSGRFPDQVVSTPISEAGIVGLAGGLALSGERPIVEIMFGDFVALAFDPILNLLSKSVGMYGRRVPMRTVVRCPVGGNRGYGPTHSQSPQKHLIGIPHLNLYELSPFHDCSALFGRMLAAGEPAVLFENKILYTERMYADSTVDDLFSYDFPASSDGCARVFLGSPDAADVVVIAPGGLTGRVLDAARRLFLEHEIVCLILVPVQLYPFDASSLPPAIAGAGRIVVVEEGTAGGGWGAEVAACLYPRLWGRLRAPIRLVTSADRVIPAARHLEDEVLVQADTVYDAVLEVAGA
ncbi:pyruvate dehydrogenase [Actinoplanes italicus]|uniref:Pyruvate dehydrogenase E1 component beta subunit n=1 Tax=Actinoplanes italicus TaxID=113567 RepID=A0A2T0KFS3_9ACTN|nr:transketolase C-terminal domain-containing protein [Actinoplanes italicus]PRX22204.1 pyruvate dehydrogenase E1 component beta subunit [Actinoplanes italicus]GIE29375.1 pyruvate dehydrogenase [Actinoplanes italicus]